jgi:hypothetical protein
VSAAFWGAVSLADAAEAADGLLVADCEPRSHPANPGKIRSIKTRKPSLMGAPFTTEIGTLNVIRMLL